MATVFLVLFSSILFRSFTFCFYHCPPPSISLSLSLFSSQFSFFSILLHFLILSLLTSPFPLSLLLPSILSPPLFQRLLREAASPERRPPPPRCQAQERHRAGAEVSQIVASLAPSCGEFGAGWQRCGLACRSQPPEAHATFQ